MRSAKRQDNWDLICRFVIGGLVQIKVAVTINIKEPYSLEVTTHSGVCYNITQESIQSPTSIYMYNSGLRVITMVLFPFLIT
jgi:hypothetical protein